MSAQSVEDRVLDVFWAERPDVVFHAAAHKHVPLLETHPAEALRTNVLGTANVAEAAAATAVGRFVLVSTDKAVRPESVMGASKWFAEQIVRSFQIGGSAMCSVRFGNVLGSRGSVIPTFLRQIGAGGPLTVTDPSMARYFMSIQEAVCLVLQAAAMSRGGEVFTLEMGEPVNILDLARRLVHLSGRVPGRDVKIRMISGGFAQIRWRPFAFAVMLTACLDCSSCGQKRGSPAWTCAATGSTCATARARPMPSPMTCW